MRHFESNSRFAAETFIWLMANAPRWVWKVITMCMYALITTYFYKFALLFSNKKNALILILSGVLPLTMIPGAFVDGSIWVTGSLNYLWIVTPGIIASYYLTEELMIEKAVSKGRRILYDFVLTFMLFITATSSMQMGAVITVLLIFVCAYKSIHTKKLNLRYTLMAFFIAASYFFVLRAPGVKLRSEQDILQYIPDFNTVGMRWKLDWSVRWIFDAVVNHMSSLLIIIWLMLIAIIYSNKRDDFFKWISITAMGTAILANVLKDKISGFFDFKAQWGRTDFLRNDYEMMLFWGIVGLITIANLIMATERRMRLAMFLVASAALTSVAVMTVSATMYASACRIMFYPSFLLMIAILMLLKEIRRVCTTRIYEIICLAIIFCALYNYQYILSQYATVFTIHFKW